MSPQLSAKQQSNVVGLRDLIKQWKQVALLGITTLRWGFFLLLNK